MPLEDKRLRHRLARHGRDLSSDSAGFTLLRSLSPEPPEVIPPTLATMSVKDYTALTGSNMQEKMEAHGIGEAMA